MNPKQTNPQQLRRDGSWSHAPYNFVPLPERVATVNAEQLPSQDTYTDNSGYLDCALTTKSPLYTRSAMTVEAFAEFGDKAFNDLPPDQQHKRARFFSIQDNTPVIPGSSLRGMVRSLLEIAAYGKMQPVSDALKITFRAVAASRDDPLAEPYREILGKFGKNIRVGYLKKNGDRWAIQPAKFPGNLGMAERGAYLKIKDRDIPREAIAGFKRFNDRDYAPAYHDVSFDLETRRGQRGDYTAVTKIGTRQAGFQYRGVLVCSGNMLETAGANQKSPRKNYALVLEPDSASKSIPIAEQIIEDYVRSLTPFQMEAPFDERFGCLRPGQPVFYVAAGNTVIWFGHTPNFRVPAILGRAKRAASPLDFVPENLRSESAIDLAEAIFGYVSSNKNKGARAGRVFFQDALLESGQGNIWLSPEPITPKVLGSPKPTTFQTYLVQSQAQRHDPDLKEKLAHYATPTPGETVIRGHKLYWHKGDVKPEDIIEGNQSKIAKAKTQYTQIMPIRSGITFRFRIYFENLMDVELGALLWVLRLPPGHWHKLGMGKPLGMGAVEIQPTLHLLDRASRYQCLFDGQGWFDGDPVTTPENDFVRAFEAFVLQHMDAKEKGTATCLAEVERIQMLLKLLEGDGPVRPEERDLLEYMEIEREPGKINEYKERPVLPDPLHIARPSHRGRPMPASKPNRTR